MKESVVDSKNWGIMKEMRENMQSIIGIWSAEGTSIKGQEFVPAYMYMAVILASLLYWSKTRTEA